MGTGFITYQTKREVVDGQTKSACSRCYKQTPYLVLRVFKLTSYDQSGCIYKHGPLLKDIKYFKKMLPGLLLLILLDAFKDTECQNPIVKGVKVLYQANGGPE